MTLEERLNLIRIKVQLKPKRARRKGRDRARLVRWRKANRERRIASGQCPRCPNPLPTGLRECGNCYSSAPYMRKLREKRTAAGLCSSCEMPIPGLGKVCDCGVAKEALARKCASCGGGKIPKTCKECRCK